MGCADCSKGLINSKGSMLDSLEFESFYCHI